MAEGRTRRSIIIGYGLAMTLTLTSFAAVIWGGFDRITNLTLLAGLAAIQILVHLKFFLHLDLSESKREDLQIVLFACLLIGLMVFGTLWVMWNLSARMMPGM